MRAFTLILFVEKKAFSSGLIKQPSSSTIASLSCYFHLFNKQVRRNKRGGWADFFFLRKKVQGGEGQIICVCTT